METARRSARDLAMNHHNSKIDATGVVIVAQTTDIAFTHDTAPTARVTTITMTAEGGSLSSDHVNYLILRYLQEAGHGKAAEELYRSWNRPYECRDPEDYTFARTVHRNDLISLIQDGLVYDELLASAAQGQKRYAFVNPELSAHDEGFVDGERQSSKRVPIHAPADDFPTPAAKRQRLSHGSEAQMNGDTSEADADGEEVDEMEVEDEEVEPVEVERYDSMDVATQTTPPPKLGPKHKITAVQWALDEEYASVLHASWATGKHGQTETLFMGGENVCKFYDVPENAEDMEQVRRDHGSFRCFQDAFLHACHSSALI